MDMMALFVVFHSFLELHSSFGTERIHLNCSSTKLWEITVSSRRATQSLLKSRSCGKDECDVCCTIPNDGRGFHLHEEEEAHHRFHMAPLRPLRKALGGSKPRLCSANGELNQMGGAGAGGPSWGSSLRVVTELQLEVHAD
ncbi:hypothetical protein MUK42_30570 [Musa troglodytarum]|uniref:Secreted protein n=1 Tax=Musa troglodytarum TaxID=320322 RepID=A0A9E7FP70_9LILI|nr:hypothetical protein MUK42_30570 [Musa troglodytarum]